MILNIKRNIKKGMALLLALTMVTPIYTGISVEETKAATPTYFEAYTKASYETTSTDFALTVSGKKVDVVEYFEGRYSYAHLAYEGTVTFEIESLNGNIDSYNVSPHSYNLDVAVSGNKLTFDMTQKESRYLVIQVKIGNQQYELIISADPNLELKAPTVDNNKVVNVKDRGVNSSNGDTGKRNSQKIQAIIDEVSANGGGTVYFPAGEYKFVTLDAKSNVTLYLDANAFLRGSGDRTEYDWADSGTNGRQANRRDILIGSGVKNFKIIGKGTIDANSAILALPQSADGGTTDVPSISRDEYNQQNGTNYYPNGWDDFRKGIVDAQNADGIEFRGVTFMDATGWTFHIQNSSNILMENVKMLNDYNIVHSDGYDLAACQYVTVSNCLGVCGDDVFCPKGSNANRDMCHYLFKDGVAYAKGGAGCKVGVQAESNTYDIEFNNIDVIRGYRGFSVSRDEGSGDWHDIRFIDIRTEKLYIENANDTGQYRPAPFIIWSHQKNDKIGDVYDVEVTRCSIENCGGLKGILEGETSATSKVPGYVSNVKFTDLVMDGRTITKDNYSTKVMYKGNVQADTISYNYTKLVAPTTSVYEAENGSRDGSSTSNATACSGEMMVGNIGYINDVNRSVTLTVYAQMDGEHEVDVYYCVSGTRSFEVTVNDTDTQNLSCTGSSFTAPSMTTMKVNLKKGENTIKFGNPNAAAPNLDKIEVQERNPDSEIAEYSLEAEHAGLAGGAEVVTAANCSNGARVGALGGNDTSSITFNVKANTAGNRTMKIYYATAANRGLNVKVNGGNSVDLTCNSNGSWDTPTTNPATTTVYLNKGFNTITLAGVNGAYAPNVDRIVLELTGSEYSAYEAAINNKIRVTCVGDSITWGYNVGINDKYSVKLQNLLGTTDFAITGCGASGAFACESSDLCSFPYITSDAYKQSLTSEPDIVTILLGTNDASGGTWSKAGYADAFRTGYENLINTYLNLDSKPRVILVTPITCTDSTRDNNNINGTIPIIKELAEKYNLTLLDLNTFTKGWNSNYLGDGLHPNSDGHTLLAGEFEKAIKNEVGAFAEITLDGKVLTDFDVTKSEYTVNYSEDIPKVDYTLSNDKVSVVVNQAIESYKTATVQVLSATEKVVKEYKINFSDITPGDSEIFTMEAEDAVLTGGVGKTASGNCSNGYYVNNVGGPVKGTVTFNVNVETAGTKELIVYYATLYERQTSVSVNGVLVGNLTCPSTGGWGNASAEPQVIYVTLDAGNNNIALSGVEEDYAPNIDKIEIIGSGSITKNEETTTKPPTEAETTTTTTGKTPGEVFGLVVSSSTPGTITVVWGHNPTIYQGELYNVYVDGKIKLTSVTCDSYTIKEIEGGNHTVKVTALLEGLETNGVSLDVNVEQSKEPIVEVEINGFQISSTVEGYRTIYSISDTDGVVESVGLIYGLADYTSDADMVVGSSNSTVFSYTATEAGRISVSYSDMESATSYAMTMRFATVGVEFLSTNVRVRAYAKLNDGTYVYSDVVATSVYDIAEGLYSGVKMNTEEGHVYLYNNILSVVNPDYKEIDYNWSNSIAGA